MFNKLMLSALVSTSFLISADRVSANEANTVNSTYSKQVTEWEESIPKIEKDGIQAKFINTIAEDAVRIAHENGIYPSVMIAQAAIESGWGRSELAHKYNNLMGIKGDWNGNSKVLATEEHIKGADITINAGFSVFDSWTESLARYGKLLREGNEQGSAFYSGAWKKNTNTYKDATAWLEGRYATDPNYANKLNAKIEEYNLNKFDNLDVEALENMVKVQKDDNLYSIAHQNEVTVEELIEWNQLEDKYINVGQWLTIGETG